MTCDIGGKVIIASHRSNPSRLQAIREYPRSDTQRLIERFERLNHANILFVRDCYIDGNSLYAFVDDLPCSLDHLVSCHNIYPTEVELGSILSQVHSPHSPPQTFTNDCEILDGMQYLCSFELSHRFLSCNGILLGLDGTIKIGRCWFFRLKLLLTLPKPA